MDNLKLYNKVREVPTEALKKINAGRLKGMSDINPMWRIKALTEEFGMCGIGWYYTIDKQWLERSDENNICAFVNITLYIKQDKEWSQGIAGTGGSKLLSKESSSNYTPIKE